MSARRAVSVTLPPGPNASTSNSAFCSSLQRRRRSGPVISVEYAIPLLTPLQTTLLAVQLRLNHWKAAFTGGVRFNSRLAAIKAVADTGADFSTLAELQAWLASDVVQALDVLPDWPTAETKAVWSSFVASFAPHEARTWSERRYWAWVVWRPGFIPVPGAPLRLALIDGQRLVMSPDGEVVGDLQAALNPARKGLVRAEVMAEANKVAITYFGPDDLWLV